MEQQHTNMPAGIDRTFGALLRYLRRRAHLTQADLAIATSYSIGQICRFEQNRRLPDATTVAARFVPALDLQEQPELAGLLIALAAAARSAPPSPVAAPAPPAPRRLPLQPTSFVGREQELRELLALLDQPSCRLLSIVGMGGMGKTRLAIEAAARFYAARGQEVVFVPLADEPSAAGLPIAIANALDLQVAPHTDLWAQLPALLRDRQALIVLDNFEHLLSSVGLIADILSAAPLVRVLVTSRAPLQISWEWLFNLEGLAYPDSASAPDADGYDAPHMFLARVRQGRRAAAFSAAERQAAARISQLVEGMPLGIELAAMLARGQPCESTAAALEQGLIALRSHMRDTPTRHISLRAIFDQSWALLADDERRALARLAVFRGGFSAAAALAVAEATPEQLGRLAERSLLRQLPDGRFGMHGLVRAYGAEQLARIEPASATHDRHLAHYLEIAEAAQPQLSGGEQQRWLARLEQEHDNLRAAIAWGQADPGRVELAMRLAGALGQFWYVRGYVRVARQIFEELLASAGRCAPAVRAGVLDSLGMLLWMQSHYAQAQAIFGQSLAIRRALGDRAGVAMLLHRLGAVAGYQGDYARATQLYEESIALSRALGNRQGVATSLNNLAVTALGQGQLARALGLLHETFDLHRALGDTLGVAIVLQNVGDVILAQGQPARARTWYCASLRLRQQVGNTQGMVFSFKGLGDAAADAGDYARALRFWGAAETLRKRCDVEIPLSDRGAYAQRLAHVRAQLGAAELQALWAAGAALTLEQALEQALAAEPPIDISRVDAIEWYHQGGSAAAPAA